MLSNALGTTWELWSSQLPTFAQWHHVLLYDHPPRRSVPELGEDVLRIADDVGFERFSFCGLSLGGMVGMWLGVNAPDRIDRLVLACTAARFGVPAEWRDHAALVRKEGMAAVAPGALEKWFTPRFVDREPFLAMQLGVAPEDYALGLEGIGGSTFANSSGRSGRPRS